ncbi:hypothetical protein ACFPOA_15765 [Lysobacter niabensis]|uniref:hypothetical protein n=1 Tax=Agrilutibacter niabensis TaxID=380628 RepID=UPI0036121B37
MPAPIELPVRAQPPFQEITYAGLPAGTEMVVRLDTAEIIASLKNRFDSVLVPERSGFSLQQEELILSNGTPYRRVWVHYEDSATWSTHGACGQNIYAWFRASGELADVFVEPLVCPI